MKMSDWGNYIKQAEFLEMAEKVAPALDDLVMFAARRISQEPKAVAMKKNVGMKKEGFGRLAAGLTGAGLGGVAGAAGASEGNKLRGALTGAALGAAGGVAARKGAQHLLAKPTAKKLVSLGWKKGNPLTGSAAEEGRSALQRYQTGLGIGAGAGGIGAGAAAGGLSDKVASEEVLAGGKADYRPNSDFSPKQLEDGQKVEMEHTHAPLVAKEIARDHLAEIPDYYTRLDAMEEEAKKDGSFIDSAKQASLDQTLGLLYQKYGPSLQKHAASLFYELDKTQLDNEALGAQFCKLAKATGVDPWSMARQIVTSYPNIVKTAASSFSPEQELASFYVSWVEELTKGAGSLSSKGDQPKLEQGERYA